jgi:hypothetical protein
MKLWIVGVALLALAVVLLSREPVPAGDDQNRQVMLEARVAELERRIARLEQAPSIAPRQRAGSAALPSAGAAASSALDSGASTSSSSSSSTGTGVEWRLGAALSGEPLRVTATELDKQRGVVDLLLKIEAPLPDSAAWPREPGRPVPVVLRAEDATGATLAELPMVLVRGPSLEPGAYLHLRAVLPERAGDRVRLLRIQRP